MANFDQSMFSYILDQTSNFSDESRCLYFYGKHIKKSLFKNQVYLLAGYMQEKGIKKGDNVVICLGNIPNAIIAFYATNIIGAIANVLHPLINNYQLEQIIKKMNPKAYFMFDEFYKEYKCLNGVNELVVVCSALDYLPKLFKPFYGAYTYKSRKDIVYTNNVVKYKDAKLDKFSKVDVKGEDLAIYMHSSGTTGKSKIACISNSAMNNMSYNLFHSVFDGETLDDKWGMLMALPIFHTFGLGVCMHTTLSNAAQVIMMPKFNVNYALILMRLTPVKIISGVPNMFRKLADSPFFYGSKIKKLSECFCGGDKLPDAVKQKFESKLRKVNNNMQIAEGYGLTEAGVCILNSQKNYLQGSIGAPLYNTKVKIFDENLNELQDGEKGYICISSDCIMQKYYEDEIETQKIKFEKDGLTWLNTKDIGYIKQGHIFFVDREKRLIKISGNNVFPQEIEDIVNKIDKVKLSCATKYFEKDKIYIRLYVQLENGVKLDDILKDKIKREIASKLLKYAIPNEIIQLEKMPLTQIGKVDFNKLN